MLNWQTLQLYTTKRRHGHVKASVKGVYYMTLAINVNDNA